ncbi:GNAT family N-acetyltransferase [Herbaspirillum lusitanum]|uniref:GNAT family N-acetyltransferase n=1 Tax=Herbaspirillum lusitanum TaxID=213312 RepID=A0ABW9AG29_9BURK
MAADIITDPGALCGVEGAGAMPACTIRAATPADVEGIAQLFNLPGFRNGTLRMPHQTVEQTRKWLETSAAAGGMNLIAVKGQHIVGQASLTRFVGRRSHAAGIGMGVHDAHCGEGIGSALLGELIEAADNWLAVQRLELTVFSDNQAAIALYRKFGFQTEGEHKAFAFRDGSYVDALCMARLHA